AKIAERRRSIAPPRNSLQQKAGGTQRKRPARSPAEKGGKSHWQRNRRGRSPRYPCATHTLRKVVAVLLTTIGIVVDKCLNDLPTCDHRCAPKRACQAGHRDFCPVPCFLYAIHMGER